MTPEKSTKYLDFIKSPDIRGRKTPIFKVVNKSGQTLGEVKYYPGWRKFCYYSNGPITYDSNCIQAIRDFMDDQNEKRRQKASR